jgi:hypothetical protein
MFLLNKTLVKLPLHQYYLKYQHEDRIFMPTKKVYQQQAQS